MSTRATYEFQGEFEAATFYIHYDGYPEGAADLAIRFSAHGRSIITDPLYQSLYPNVKLTEDANQKKDWRLTKGGGLMAFPAKAADYEGEGEYPNEYLFEERYSKQWYETQYATLGKYSASALMDCRPISRSGGRFSVAGIEWMDVLPEKPLRWVRVWDLAHTAKQRSGDDPERGLFYCLFLCLLVNSYIGGN